MALDLTLDSSRCGRRGGPNRENYLMRFILPLLLLALSLPASASPDKTALPHGFVYAITDDGVAYGYRVLPSGTLAPLPLPPVSIKPFVRTPQPDYPNQAPDTYNQQGWSVAADPIHALLYVTGYHASLNMHPDSAAVSPGQSWGALQVYRISSDGSLVPVYKNPWSFRESLGPITVDPQGRFVWIERADDQEGDGLFVQGGGGGVFVFKHGQGGMLRRVGKTGVIGTFPSVLPSGSTDDSGLVVARDGNNAYSYYNTGFVDHHEYAVAAYRILPNGRFRYLGEDASHREASSLMSFALGADGHFLYVASDAVSQDDKFENYGIFDYPLAENGLKSPRFLVPYPQVRNEWHPITIQADPNGCFLFASDYKGLRVYAINKDGTLTLRSINPGLDERAVSQDGRFIYALTTLGEAGKARTVLVSERVESDGNLTGRIHLLLPNGVSVRQILVF